QPQQGFIQPQPMTANGFNTDFSSNNPYMQSQQQFGQQPGVQPTSPGPQNMSNNPYSQHQPQPENLQPIPTGSNNPFAQFGPSFNQPQHQQQQSQRTSFPPSL